MKADDLIKLLEAKGWQFVRQRGSHQVFKHPDFPQIIVVPKHGKEDLKKGLLNSIMKEAGLK